MPHVSDVVGGQFSALGLSHLGCRVRQGEAACRCLPDSLPFFLDGGVGATLSPPLASLVKSVANLNLHTAMHG